MQDLRDIKDLKALLRFTPKSVGARNIEPEEVTHVLRLCEAYWQYPGKPDHEIPHAELTSGKCSDGFVNALEVLTYPNMCEIFARELALKLDKELDVQPNWVIGSDHAGATFSYEVARRFKTARHEFAEKGPDVEMPDGSIEKTQIWKRFAIKPEESVLQVEELVTTSATLKAVRKGIREGNPYPVNFAMGVGTLVHRSKETHIEGSPIVSVVHYDIGVWDPKECPYCAVGSKRLKPKKNWAELTAAVV